MPSVSVFSLNSSNKGSTARMYFRCLQHCELRAASFALEGKERQPLIC
jgi:hypothetical protein